MLKIVRNIVCVILIAVFLLSLIYVILARHSDNIPSLFGYSLLRISSESMEPELKSGDIVLLKITQPEKLQKGDVISYKGTKGVLKDTTVTHQIVAEPYEKDGTYYFTTRGIRNGALDDPEINETQILGKVTLKIPLVGTLYDFFNSWYGIISFFTLILLAFSGELKDIFKKISDKKKISDSDIPSDVSIPQFRPEFNEVLIKDSIGNDFITTDDGD